MQYDKALSKQGVVEAGNLRYLSRAKVKSMIFTVGPGQGRSVSPSKRQLGGFRLQ